MCQACQTVYLKKKPKTIAGPLFKGNEVNQDEPDFEKDKKVSSTVEGRTLHPLLDTLPKFYNKRDYKGDTQDETPVSIKLHPNVFKKYYLEIKRALEIERENASDKEYFPLNI